MAFNLYCNGTPSVDDELDAEEQIDECRRYSAEDLFCCCYAPFSGRQYRSGIQNMQIIIMLCMQCLEEMIDVKSQIDGNKE